MRIIKANLNVPDSSNDALSQRFRIEIASVEHDIWLNLSEKFEEEKKIIVNIHCVRFSMINTFSFNRQEAKEEAK